MLLSHAGLWRSAVLKDRPATPRMVVRPGQFKLHPFEKCILDASTEDEVQQCLLLMEEDAESNAEDRSAQPSMCHTVQLHPFEECIFYASTEEEVQQCLLLKDESTESTTATTANEVELCMLDAYDEESMQACLDLDGDVR